MEAALRFALSTLFMKQGRLVAGSSEGAGHRVQKEASGLASGHDDPRDYGFEPGEIEIDDEAGERDEQVLEAQAPDSLLAVVLACMGRLRDMCEGSCRDGECDVEEGFRGVARELREFAALDDMFVDLLRLLMDLLRAADAEGETMDAASVSHVLTHLCFEETGAPSYRFNEVVPFLIAALNDARGTTLSEWVSQSLDEVDASVHDSS